jgi:hypothetical protein
MKVKPVGIATNITKKSESFYKEFPYELTHKEHDSVKTCWFSDEYDMRKYMERYKIKDKECNIVIRKQSGAS